jgi:predicted ATPase/DNA-binding SARP family transcriptional activator
MNYLNTRKWSNKPFQIHLLGAPLVTWNDHPVLLTRRQERALLYFLACEGKPVSRERLSFILYPDEPESQARRKISRRLSHLQAELPSVDLMHVNPLTVSLSQEKVWVDAAALEDRLENPNQSYQDQVVDLYRGRFLEGFSLPKNPEFDHWLTEKCVDFENKFLATLANLLQRFSASGEYHEGIKLAQRYLAVDELAENVHRCLIQLYSAVGNRSAALQQYETCVLILERELGVEPLPETRQAYFAALKGKTQPPVLKVFPEWMVLPSLEVPLTGREGECEELQSAYKRYLKGGLILITGEAGIGKSRLMQEFTSSKRRLVLTGNCYFSAQVLPYQPIIQPLRQALTNPELWEGIQTVWLTETARLIPEIPEIFPGLPPPINVAPDQAQARLYEGLTQCFFGLARNAPILLCLDDLHWMDEASKGWLAAVSSRLDGSGLCILGAYRLEEANTVSYIKEIYSRRRLLAEVTIRGLFVEAVCKVLFHLPQLPAVPELLAERIAAATGGNPFFILETLRVLLESGRLDSPVEELPLARSIQETVQQRVSRLSPVYRQVLETAAVLNPVLEFELLVKTAGRSEQEISDGLEELVRRQLLSDGEKIRFKHDLLAQSVYQHISPGRLRLLHRRAAESYIQVFYGQQDEFSGQIARHYDQAGEVETAVKFFIIAAQMAQARYAHDEAINYLNTAILDSSKLTSARQNLALLHNLLGDSWSAKGEYEAAWKSYQQVLGMLSNRENLTQVEIYRKLAWISVHQHHIEEFTNIYNTAIALLGTGPEGREEVWQIAWMDLQLCRLESLYLQGDLKQLDDLIKKVTPYIEKVGKPKNLADFNRIHGEFSLRHERYLPTSKSILIWEKALLSAQEWGNQAAIADAAFSLGFSYLMSGDLYTAEKVLTDSLKLAEGIGLVRLQCQCHTYLTQLSRMRGDLQNTLKHAGQSLELATKVNVAVYIGAAQAHLAWLDWKDLKQFDVEKKALASLVLLEEVPYPFKWYACWVLCALYFSHDRIADALASLRAMLHPTQQRLPEGITAAMEGVIQDWQLGKESAARKGLGQVVEMAKERGYL